MHLPVLSLVRIKLIHTVVWAFFATCILALPIAGLQGSFGIAFVLIAVTMVEVVILAANGMRCPLTDIAARFTDDRRDNFDIYLPEWLARNNKLIFGSLFLAGVAFTLAKYFGWSA